MNRPDTTPTVSLVVVNWNQKELLRRGLLSIRQHSSEVSHEVIVVDNASADGSQQLVRSEFPEVELIEKPDNRGYGQALNTGMRAARGKFIFLLNNDMVLLPDTLRILAAFMEAHPEAGVIGCRFFTDITCTNLQPSAFQVYPTPWNDVLDRVIGDRLRRLLPDSTIVRQLTARWDRAWVESGGAAEVAFVVGAAMMTRREVVAQDLFFDEQFHIFLEETDWCRRLQRSGWKVYQVPQAAIVHLHGGSYPTPEERRVRARLYYDSYLKYLRKHESRTTVAFAKVVHLVSRAGRNMAPA